MSLTPEQLIEIAISEAKESLREGNNGFGAVIYKDGQIIAQAHDKEETESDPTSHAELNAIRIASKKIGKNLSGSILISTHEPCPMCSTGIVWSGISEIGFGYSIKDALKQGRTRIDLPCFRIFEYAKKDIKIHENILYDECSILYNKDVREQIKKLRNITLEKMKMLNDELSQKRINWFNQNTFNINDDLLLSGYNLLLKKLDIKPSDAPIIKKTDMEIIFHSKNFCPTLEACKILNLDTRIICKEIYEKSTDALLKCLSPQLNFSRNHEKIRPYCEYCEEMVRMKK